MSSVQPSSATVPGPDDAQQASSSPSGPQGLQGLQRPAEPLDSSAFYGHGSTTDATVSAVPDSSTAHEPYESSPPVSTQLSVGLKDTDSLNYPLLTVSEAPSDGTPEPVDANMSAHEDSSPPGDLERSITPGPDTSKDVDLIRHEQDQLAAKYKDITKKLARARSDRASRMLTSLRDGNGLVLFDRLFDRQRDVFARMRGNALKTFNYQKNMIRKVTLGETRNVWLNFYRSKADLQQKLIRKVNEQICALDREYHRSLMRSPSIARLVRRNLRTARTLATYPAVTPLDKREIERDLDVIRSGKEQNFLGDDGYEGGEEERVFREEGEMPRQEYDEVDYDDQRQQIEVRPEAVVVAEAPNVAVEDDPEMQHPQMQHPQWLVDQNNNIHRQSYPQYWKGLYVPVEQVPFYPKSPKPKRSSSSSKRAGDDIEPTTVKRRQKTKDDGTPRIKSSAPRTELQYIQPPPVEAPPMGIPLEQLPGIGSLGQQQHAQHQPPGQQMPHPPAQQLVPPPPQHLTSLSPTAAYSQPPYYGYLDPHASSRPMMVPVAQPPHLQKAQQMVQPGYHYPYYSGYYEQPQQQQGQSREERPQEQAPGQEQEQRQHQEQSINLPPPPPAIHQQRAQSQQYSFPMQQLPPPPQYYDGQQHYQGYPTAYAGYYDPHAVEQPGVPGQPPLIQYGGYRPGAPARPGQQLPPPPPPPHNSQPAYQVM